MDIASQRWIQLTHESAAPISPPGRPMAATSFFSVRTATAKSGPCWPTAPGSKRSPQSGKQSNAELELEVTGLSENRVEKRFSRFTLLTKKFFEENQ